MLSTEGMAPMGAGLQEPVVICLPLVMGKLGTVRQKLIKLLLDVKDFTCPAAGTSWPSFLNPVARTRGSRVKDVWGLPPPPGAALAAAAAEELLAVVVLAVDVGLAPLSGGVVFATAAEEDAWLPFPPPLLTTVGAVAPAVTVTV